MYALVELVFFFSKKVAERVDHMKFITVATVRIKEGINKSHQIFPKSLNT